jgi:hypothetical protein
MIFSRVSSLMLAVTISSAGAFQAPPCPMTHYSSASALLAKARKARREEQKVGRSRPDTFYDAIEDANDRKVVSKVAPPTNATNNKDDVSVAQDAAEREARAEKARERMDQRPEVSTMFVDEESGMEIVAQGKSVMDVVTRKAVVLSSRGPEYRLAQMFPGVPLPIREKYRFDWKTITVPQMVEALQVECSNKGEIPPHPSVTSKAIDFVLANRDFLGYKMKRTLVRLQMNALSTGDAIKAQSYQKLSKNFLTLENHISAPFRQMIMDGEGRVGPNFGNLDIMSYCGGELYVRCANYLVLKGMVAHWEKKVVDAEYVEKTPQTKANYMRILSRGDPKRYLPDPPILFTLKECTQVCYMAQQMTKAFVETPALFDDLPPEIRFLEQALSIKGGTPLRKYMIEDFCPAEGITPAALREGLRRLYTQLENMQIDPYGDMCNIVERLILALSIGTDDERDPYAVYLVNKDPKGPGAFQSYTFNHEQLSLVRFLDGQYESAGAVTMPSASDAGGFAALFKFGDKKPSEQGAFGSGNRMAGDTYIVPKERAAGRPHELGWLDLLSTNKNEKLRLGEVPAGKIIADDE